MKTSVLIIVVVVMMMLVMSSSAAAVAAFVLWTPPPPTTPPTTPPSPTPPPSGTNIGGTPPSGTNIGPSGTNPGSSDPGTFENHFKPLIFMDTCGLGDEANGRAADALRMAEGKDWEYVAANIDGFSANGYGTIPNLWPKIMDQAKKKPTWVMHGTTVASEFINKKEYFVPLYDAELKRQNVNHRVYGWLVYFDGDPPNGRQWEPGVVTKWKNFEPFAKVTPRIFGRTNGPEIYLCWEKACEDNYSALRESDGWVYEATPDVVAESLMNDPKEWPDHRLAWKKLHEECKKYNKKMLWLMATTGKGSLKEAQDSFAWLKKENLLPDVIIVSNYGTEDNGRKDYRAIPEGKGDDYPDTVTGIARWLLVNR